MNPFKFSSKNKGQPEEEDLKDPDEPTSYLMSCSSDVESHNEKRIKEKEKSEYAPIVGEGHLAYKELDAELLLKRKSKEFIEIIKNHYLNDTGSKYESKECRIKSDKQVIEEASSIMFESLFKARLGGNIPENQMVSYIKYLHERIDQLAFGYSEIEEPKPNPGMKHLRKNNKLILERQVYNEQDDNHGY